MENNSSSAKIDITGKLIMNRKDLERMYLDTYVARLEPNEVEEGYEDLREYDDELFDLRLKLSKSIKGTDWSMQKLEKVLKSLKNNKARDSHGHSYELFKYGGASLKLSILRMFNKIKKGAYFPSILRPSNITSIWKKKGPKSDMDSYRGIFNVTKLRSIMD